MNKVAALPLTLAVLALFGWTMFRAQGSRIPVRIRVTNHEIAISNLNSQISSLEQLIAEKPGVIQLKSQLAELLLTRLQFLGTYSDFQRIHALIPAKARTVSELLLRARYNSAIHDFKAAAEDLEEVRRIEPTNNKVDGQLLSVKLAQRFNLQALRPAMESQLKRSRTYKSLLLMSALEAELGHFDAADTLMEEAISNYKDSSPFPIAYLYFQRGVLWAEKAGDTARGRRFYEEAVHYLPEFVQAQVHLAEIQKTDGESSLAIESLRPLISSEDPEPRGVLSSLLKESGKVAEAEELKGSAEQSYDQLLQGYPLAFADHAAEFFTGTGANPQRALKLARLNLENRPTERSYLVALRAALAADEIKDACALADRARLIEPKYVLLLAELKSSEARCGEQPH